MSSTTESASLNDAEGSGAAQVATGISLIAFVTALAASLVVFGVQMGFFLLLRNKLVRIFKPKTYLVPERERTDPPPSSHWALAFKLMSFQDREIIKKCGLDAYFFLRYLQTLLIIFIPIALVVIPILVPLNYIGGMGREIINSTADRANDSSVPTGLDTLAWGNVAPNQQHRRWAHLVLALLVIFWVCGVFFAELKVYVKIRQDYLTSAEHRLRASANTVLVSSIPNKWLTEEALRGLFDVFPGGIRNVWLTRDFTALLEKIHERDRVHKMLEEAESELIRMAKKKQLKQARKGSLIQRLRSGNRAEKAQRAKAQDQEAQRRAEGSGGLSANTPHVPRGVHDAIAEADHQYGGTDSADFQEGETKAMDPPRRTGNPLVKIGQGLGKGVGKGVAAVGGVGLGLIGGAKAIQKGIDGGLERTDGFDFVKPVDPRASPSMFVTDDPDSPRRVHMAVDDEDKPKTSFASEAPLTSRRAAHAHTLSDVSQDLDAKKETFDPRSFGNTTRRATNLDEMIVTEKTWWFQFWKPPTGSYASPIPQGAEGDEYPWRSEKKSFWQSVKDAIPFLASEPPPVDYPTAYTRDYKTQPEEDAEWRKWIKPEDRPHHRIANFEWTPRWLPSLPLINKKVDTIYWCRAELARLNMEVEEDQKHPERYPVMNAAFIQFNHQVAAHMACQSVTHHIPKQMTPRMVEISPDDVIWDNMAISWWGEWARRIIVFVIVAAMVILWAFPVAWTASLSQIDALIREYSWLEFLASSQTLHNAVKAVAGVLPALVLAIILALVPVVLGFLAVWQGSKTGSRKSEIVQIYYFVFLFVQVFLVVSIASGALQTIANISSNLTSTPNILAENLPKAANYFFAYMILQALSTSSGTLLQIGTLLVWYVWSRIVDNTARAKWTRNTQLPTVTWGSFFPVYTNFACIALIYSIVAPLISLFAIITFSLLWVAHRYNMLYVTRFKTDTGGVLYPRAINQTFTGLYVMELCLIGLFFLAEDEAGFNTCIPQAIIMIITLFLTILYQYVLNGSFGPLLRYLPITFEDEAVLRDEAFQRAQARRLGLLDDDDDEAATLNRISGAHDDDIELEKLGNKKHGTNGSVLGKFNPVKGIAHASTWAARGGKQIRQATFGKAEDSLRTAALYRKQRRQKDLEAQRAMGDALFGGYSDVIEDLTPEERDVLVRKAFQHSALRARRPVVWIPRDDLGISDDEIRRTNDFSEYISITNEGTALDSRVRVVYGRNPPDFSEVDLINL
ncbi:Phm7-similarity to hyp1 [Madurella fahalii]|uniref:Phm7-similarity to hyp1 n=1 Tax=Madurella fahalii TaxID=1157608 RepID=A0ABQ0GMH3_9PEZI